MEQFICLSISFCFIVLAIRYKYKRRIVELEKYLCCLVELFEDEMYQKIQIEKVKTWGEIGKDILGEEAYNKYRIEE
jgi:hypothetical protein